MQYSRLSGPLVALLGLALAAAPAPAAFHLWTFSEFFSSSDGSVQFIELFTTSNFETVATGAQIRTTSANHVFNFPAGDLPPTANKRLLFATSNFSALAGGVTPDYILPIPSFFNRAGDTVRLFHPFFQEFHSKTFSALPSDGVQSLNYPPVAGAAAGNTPTNFADSVGGIDLTPPPVTTGDYNLDLKIDAADYTVWRDTFGLPASPKGSGADGDGDGTIDEGDYTFWKTRFGVDLGGAGGGSTAAVLVPEPALCSLLLPGLGALFFARSRGRRTRPRI